MKFLSLFFVIFLVNCTAVPPGNVGILVNLYGGDKGVSNQVLPAGRYWVGINEQLFVFPTFEQNYVWTKSAHEGSPHDESITFQTKEGLSVNTDVGISYHIEADKVPTVFQKFRRNVEEITDIFLRNSVRDALISTASKLDVEYIYGAGKSDLLKDVQTEVSNEVGPLGVSITKIYFVGEFRLPEPVLKAINLKIEATQRAQQRENELREAEAQARKEVAEAEGAAKVAIAGAQAEAESIKLKSQAEAQANKLLSQSITDNLIKYEQSKRWDGKLPEVITSGSNIPIVKMK